MTPRTIAPVIGLVVTAAAMTWATPRVETWLALTAWALWAGALTGTIDWARRGGRRP